MKDQTKYVGIFLLLFQIDMQRVFFLVCVESKSAH